MSCRARRQEGTHHRIIQVLKLSILSANPGGRLLGTPFQDAFTREALLPTCESSCTELLRR